MLRHLFPRGTVLAALFFASCVANIWGLAAGLNDTGQTKCYDGGGGSVSCSSTAGGDGSATPRQDARYGRDAAAAAFQLVKVGAGSAGFDYTKIANDGSTLAASAALGGNAGDWACTKDNVTGLTWEVKTTSGLRTNSYLYLWYSTDATRNGGKPGTFSSVGVPDTCSGSQGVIVPSGNPCNTQNFANAVNAVGMCGKSDWRLPTQGEMLSLLHFGKTDHIQVDDVYFPNTLNNSYTWTSSTNALDAGQIWIIDNFQGRARYTTKSAYTQFYVRLVRDGP